MGVERVISTNAVGAINKNYGPGDFVVPYNIIDFTRSRATTFHDDSPVINIDVTNPYCPELRKLVEKSTKRSCRKYWLKSVLAVTDGPRFETPAEIRMMRKMGCDIVGMTGSPEVFLAREKFWRAPSRGANQLTAVMYPEREFMTVEDLSINEVRAQRGRRSFFTNKSFFWMCFVAHKTSKKIVHNIGVWRSYEQSE